MRATTSANTKRAKQAQPLQSPEETPFLESAGGEGPGLIARDATPRGEALTGLLVDCNAAGRPVDVPCVCGTALSTDRLSLSHGPSGLVGRVLESGHAAGEPILCELKEPLGASVGFSQGEAGTTIDDVFMGADNALPVVNLAGGGDAATAGDVAAGPGRDVARIAVRIAVTDPGSCLEPHLRSPDHNASGGYGLAIVEKLCSAWGVARDSVGTTNVWCELPLDTALLQLSTDREYRTVRQRRSECLRPRSSPEHEEAR